MKRRTTSRRQVLNLETNSKSSSPRRTWQTKYQQICLDHSQSQNGGSSSTKKEKKPKQNALQGLEGSYKSDSEDEKGRRKSGDLDAKVENFMKEISEIAPTPVETKTALCPVETKIAPVNKLNKTSESKTTSSTIANSASAIAMSQPIQYASQAYTAPTSAWQECYDESTGCCYYWNVETNAVTWEIPPEVQAYKVALEQWKAQQLLLGHGAVLQGYMPQVMNSNIPMMMQPQQQESIPIKTNKRNKRKAKKGRHSDSEDEKIEMITFYGPSNSGESDSEDETSTKPPSPKKKKTQKTSDIVDESVNDGEDTIKSGTQLADYVLEDSNSSSALQSLVSYGADPGPPGADDHDEDFNSYYRHSLLSNIPDTGPPGEDSVASLSESNDFVLTKSTPLVEKTIVSEKTKELKEEVVDNREEMIIIDTETDMEKKSALQRLKSLKQKASDDRSSHSSNEEGEKEESSSEGEDGESEEDVDESSILDRLRSQARVLQDLGGEIPDEIKDLIEPTKESPTIEEENQPEVKIDKDPAPTSFSLIAGYGDDSDPEDDAKSDEKVKEVVKPLFPIVGIDLKDKPILKKSTSSNLKVIKLSARAKALINASTTTGKARATDFVKTSEGLKPVDSVAAIVKEAEMASKADTESNLVNSATNQKPSTRKKRLGVAAVVKSEVPTTAVKSDVSQTAVRLEVPTTSEKFEVPSTSIKSEIPKTIIRSEVPKTSVKSEVPKPTVKLGVIVTTTETDLQIKPSYSFGYTSAWNYNSDLMSGERRGFGFSTENYPKKTESKKTPIQFIKAETLMPPKVEPIVIETDKALSKKQNNSGKGKESVEEASELSQLIMEKVKFLGEGKEAVAPVQTMAIQLETLVSAWEAGGLSLQYMSSWLMAMASQLAGLEQAAAPKGWLCEWNRSYKRYFYRNKENGAIQWEYPATEEEVQAEENQPPAEPSGGGEEAMELCDTPPPSATPPPPVTTTPPPPVSPPPLTTPPPPSISSPRSVSPPPPPWISKEPASPESFLLQAEIELKEKEASLPPPLPPSSPVTRTNPPLPPLPPPPPPLPPSTPPPLPPDTPPPPPIYSNEPLPPGVDHTEDYYPARPPLPPAPPPPPPPPQTPPPAPPVPVEPVLAEVEPYTMGYEVATGTLLYDPYNMHADYSSGLVGPHYGHSATSMYSTTQESYVIARPPANTLPVNLATELNSFYNDIAALEPVSPPKPPTPEPVVASPSPPPRQETPPPLQPEVLKKKKKTKLAPGLSLKKKDVSSLVAKWQQVQQDARKESSEET